MSPSDPGVKRYARIALVGAAVVVVLVAPFNTAAYLATVPEGDFGSILPWADAFREALPGAFAFDPPEEAHRVYTTLANLAWVLLLVALPALRGTLAGPTSRSARVGYWTLVLAAVLLLVSGLLETLRMTVWPIGLAGALLLIPAHVMLGLGARRGRLLSPTAAWTLVAGGALVIPFTALFGNFLFGFVPCAIAWMLLARETPRAQEARPATQAAPSR